VRGRVRCASAAFSASIEASAAPVGVSSITGLSLSAFTAAAASAAALAATSAAW